VNEASVILLRWLAQPPAIVVEATSRHAGVLAGLLAEAGTAGNLVNDAHLAALAIEHDAVLMSFDADFGRFPGLRCEMSVA
jgi:predicted nucleic acid-binding protein